MKEISPLIVILNMDLKIIESADGSHTLLLSSLNETYHSTKGAITESLHVFLKEGLEKFIDVQEVTILEIGFGTGLNAILTLLKGLETGQKINYHTLEPFPLPKEIISKLNYTESLHEILTGYFLKLHEASWNEDINITPGFNFRKYNMRLEDFNLKFKVDLIYYDAFAPSKQPEVWSLENLSKCFEILNPGGILVTYCAQGQFKRNLKAAGFEVEIIEGPPGKKEMTRGVKGI